MEITIKPKYNIGQTVYFLIRENSVMTGKVQDIRTETETTVDSTTVKVTYIIAVPLQGCYPANQDDIFASKEELFEVAARRLKDKLSYQLEQQEAIDGAA